VSLSKGVYIKDDCSKLKIKDSHNTRRSKQNTYHVVKKIEPQVNLPIDKDEREDAIRGIPKLRSLVVLEYYLGVPLESPSLGSCHSLLCSPPNLYPKLENFTTQNSTENS